MEHYNSINNAEGIEMQKIQSVNGPNKNTHGFTLVEIIAALAIIGILSAVAVSRVSSTDDYKLASEVEILKSHLRYAQSRAMSNTAVSWGIVIAGDGKSYTLQKDGADASTLPNENSFTHTFLDGVTSSAANVTFDIWGSSSGTTVTLSTSSDSSTITVTANTGFIP